MLGVSFGLAFLFAATFVLVLTLALPPDDAMSRVPFADTFVDFIGAAIASIAAIVVFPFIYFALRTKPLLKSVGVIIAIVVVEIIAFTPLYPPCGFLGSFVAFGVGLILARIIPSDGGEKAT
jgi:hypothetical protein